jgi:hypothetical protein
MLQIKFSVHSAARQTHYSAQMLSFCSLQHTANIPVPITLPPSLPDTFPCLQPTITRTTIWHFLEVFTPVSPPPPSSKCICCQYTAASFYSYSSRVFRGFVPQPSVVLSLQEPILHINVSLIRKAVVCVPRKVTCRELLDQASAPPQQLHQNGSCKFITNWHCVQPQKDAKR